MPVPATIADLDTDESLNSPNDSETITPSTRPSDYIRAHAAIIKTLSNDSMATATLAASGGSALVGFLQSGTGAVARTAQAKMRDTISVFDFMTAAQIADVQAGTQVYDCTAAIQAAIDAAIYNDSSDQSAGLKLKVRIPGGIYRITDTIHLGYGTAFNSVVVEGDGYRYRGSTAQSGTAIFADFNDRPAFNFQGARGSVLRGMSINGENYTHVATNNLGGYGGASVDDTNVANWVDPLIPAASDSQYAPYAGVTIDAYAGVRPATSYPDVTYPAFLGAVSQYGKLNSSKVLIEDVMVSGFVAGVVNMPSNADSNGDFTSLQRVYIEACKYAVSVGNSQSRNFSIRDASIAQVWIAFTNRTHGKKIGKMNGTIDSVSIGQCMNIVDLNAVYAGPLTFLHLYAESTWRIGDIVAGSTNENSIKFQSCDITLGLQSDGSDRGVPAMCLSNPLGTIGTKVFVTFDDCTISGFPSVLTLGNDGTTLVNTHIKPIDRATGTLTYEYQAIAHNALCGGVVTPVSSKIDSPQSIKFKLVDQSTRVVGSAELFTSSGYKKTTRKYCIPFYARDVSSLSDTRDSIIVHNAASSFTKSTVINHSLTDKTLTFEFASRSETTFAYYGPLPGDVLVDSDSGMVFFVRSRVGLVVIAEAQNNYKADGLGGFDQITAYQPTVGTMYIINGRMFTPPYYLEGDSTAASAVLTNCGRSDGYAAWYDAEILVDDWIYVDATKDSWGLAMSVSKVSARDQAAATITVSGNITATVANKQLKLFIKQPPASV